MISSFFPVKFSFLKKLFLCGVLQVIFISCEAQSNSKKINGVSFVASRQVITTQDFEPVLNVNANAVAVMPFGFMESLSSPTLKFNVERQWWGEKVEGAGKTIQMAKENGLEVLLKPQIWIQRGDFTGHLDMPSEEDWIMFENNYREFILLYARLAESEDVEMFCIGTELNSFVVARPNFWTSLIAEIKDIYKGELTYAENWDKIEEVSFWKELDYIGVDAYFPLSEKLSPSIGEIRAGWQPVKKQLKALSKQHKKPILFTEYGYRNIDYAVKNPWDASRELVGTNNDSQANALNALYQELWEEKWFAGGYLWKWHHDQQRAGGEENNQFTPQNKPAEAVVKEFYGKFSVK